MEMAGVANRLDTFPAYLGNPHDSPLWQEVADELERAMLQHGPMASGHEAQSVIGEEFHEFTLAVWFGVDQHGRPADPRHEAIQIAAMALRYIRDVADR
jgi:hypothetical protein